MTTNAAEQLYLSVHLNQVQGRPCVVYNPHGKPVNELPVIYGFNNGGSPGWLSAIALAEDGSVLGGHVCSHESYMPYDLGILEGSRPDRHADSYHRHYSDGYRMEFVPRDAIGSHVKLQAAFVLNREAEQGKHEQGHTGATR